MPRIIRAINNLQISLGTFDGYPTAGLNVANPASLLHVTIPTDMPGIIIQQAAGQTQLPLQIKNNGGTPVWQIAADGSTTAANFTSTGVLTMGTGPTQVTDTTGKVRLAALPIIDTAHGGLNVTSLTAHALLAGNATTDGIEQIVGTSTGQILTWSGTQWGAVAPLGGGNISNTGATETVNRLTMWLGTTVITNSNIQQDANGSIGINVLSGIAGQVHVQTNANATPTMLLERKSGQTADILRLVAEDGTTVMVNIAATGYVGLGGPAMTNALVTASGTIATIGSDLYGWNAGGFTLSPADTYNATFAHWGGVVASIAGATNPHAYSVYVDALSKTGTGTITTAYGMYVNNPTAGTQNIAAYFGGQTQIASAFGTNTQLGIGGTVPLLTGNGSHGIYLNSTLNPDNGLGAFAARLTGTVNVTAGNTAVAYGLSIDQMAFTGAGTVTTAYGLFVQNPTIGTTNVAANFGGNVGIGAGNSIGARSDSLLALSGTVSSATNAYGIYESLVLTPASGNSAVFKYIAGSIYTGASTTTGNAYGIYLSTINNSGTGTVPNYYGLYIAPNTVGTANYAAYFGGIVGVNITAPVGSLHVLPINGSTIPLIVQPVGGQNTATQEWRNSTGAVQASVTASGSLVVNPTAPTGANIVSRAIASPIQNLQEWQDSGSNALLSITPTGGIYATPLAPAASLIRIKNIASPTQNYFEWINSGNTSQGYIAPFGSLFLNPSAPTTPIITIKGIATPTVSYLQVQNNTGSPLLDIGIAGTVGIGGTAAAGTILNINKSIATASGNQIGINNVPTFTPANNTSAYGDFITPTVATTAAQTVTQAASLYLNGATKTGTGTITASYGLYVVGGLSTSATNVYAAQFTAGDASAGGVRMIGINNQTTDILTIQATNGGTTTNALNVNGNGFVGIGTAIANAQKNIVLQVGGTVNTANTGIGINVIPTLITSTNNSNIIGIEVSLTTNTTLNAISTVYNFYSANPFKIGANTVNYGIGYYSSNLSVGSLNNYSAQFDGKVLIGTQPSSTVNGMVTITPATAQDALVITPVASPGFYLNTPNMTWNGTNMALTGEVTLTATNSAYILNFAGTKTISTSPIAIESTVTLSSTGAGQFLYHNYLSPTYSSTGGSATAITNYIQGNSLAGVTSHYGIYELGTNGFGGTAALYGAYFSNAVGIGATTPSAKLVVNNNASFTPPITAMSTTFVTYSPTIGNAAGNSVLLTSHGTATGTNGQISLGLYAYRHTAGTDYTGTALLLGADYNSSALSWGYISLYNNRVGINITNPSTAFHVNGVITGSSDINIGGNIANAGFINSSGNIFTPKVVFNGDSTNYFIGPDSVSGGYGIVSNIAIRMRYTNVGAIWFNSPNVLSSPVIATESQIANDLAAYASLCLLGNSSAGAGSLGSTTRRIRLFDDVVITGALSVTGALSKGSGTFKIDHPLYPQDKNLYHGFVEAPRYDLIYRGRVTLVNGQATVNIDAESNMEEGTFTALTKNVDIFVTNKTGWARVKVTDIHDDNSFTILCEDTTSTDTVTWLVIAERNDPFIRHSPGTDSNGSLLVEEDKAAPSQTQLDELNPIVREKIVTEQSEVVADKIITERVDALIGLKGYPYHADALGLAWPTRQVTIKTVLKETDV